MVVFLVFTLQKLIYIRYFIHVALPLNNCIRSDFDIKDENIVFTYCFLYLRLQNKKNQAINCLVPSIHEDDKHRNFFCYDVWLERTSNTPNRAPKSVYLPAYKIKNFILAFKVILT